MRTIKKKRRVRRPSTKMARLQAAMAKGQLRFELHRRRLIALVGTDAQLEQLGQMSAVEIAARLRISVATAHRWCATGRLPARRSGRTWLVDVAAVQAFQLKRIKERQLTP